MNAKKKVVENENVDSQQARSEIKFRVDYDAGAAASVSIALLIASRKCYQCRQNDIEASVAQSDPKIHVERVSQHCFKAADYLLPDTPLKEAVFRILLSNRNRGMTAEGISTALSTRWAKSTNSREISAGIIRSLLETSPYYQLVTVT